MISNIILILDEILEFFVAQVEKPHNPVNDHQDEHSAYPIPNIHVLVVRHWSFIRVPIQNKNQNGRYHEPHILYDFECQIDLIPEDVQEEDKSQLNDISEDDDDWPNNRLLNEKHNKNAIDEIP